MCTVTFIPAKEKIFITSNRDEKAWRKQALAPAFYNHSSSKLLYPKDADKGGSWITFSNNGNAAVLLNGAFVKHEPDARFTKSRGIIFIEITESKNPVETFSSVDLSATEPFTLILFAGKELYECRWDGTKKYQSLKDKKQPHIWSSATLYGKETVLKREAWFNEWLQKNNSPAADDILHFHLFGGEGDNHNDIRMNRNGKVFTVSVTNMEISESFATMRYLDMKDESIHTQSVSFTNIPETTVAE
jgi:uncharacterized protein with NRDE domain